MAKWGGQVVGHLCLLLDRLPAHIAAEHRAVGYVSDAYVQEGMRGRGIFRALLAEAERFALTADATRLLVGVLAGNARAERAWRFAGFRPYALDLVKELKRSA